MIDELVLERMFNEAADEIPVPEDGAELVVEELSASSARAPRRPSARSGRLLLAAAAAVVLVLAIGVSANNRSHNQKTVSALQAGDASTVTSPADFAEAGAGASSDGAAFRFQQVAPRAKAKNATSNVVATSGATDAAADREGRHAETTAGSSSAPAGTVDGAKIVKTGSLDLQVPHATLHTAVNRVTGVAVGLGGYIADSKSNFGGVDATAQITIRVPVNNFETAVTRLERLPDVKVLGSSENGTDVTGQYKDLEAQLAAATAERDAFLGVLANAESVGDILAVRDRITAVETEMNQLQGQINLLENQATLSSIAVTLAEKPVHKAATTVAGPPSGLSKAWRDARDGFSNTLEWLVARSGGALIVLLAGIVLLFGIRYLYPVVRRGLL